jgi:hypothetical protein
MKSSSKLACAGIHGPTWFLACAENMERLMGLTFVQWLRLLLFMMDCMTKRSIWPLRSACFVTAQWFTQLNKILGHHSSSQHLLQWSPSLWCSSICCVWHMQVGGCAITNAFVRYRMPSTISQIRRYWSASVQSCIRWRLTLSLCYSITSGKWGETDNDLHGIKRYIFQIICAVLIYGGIRVDLNA